MTKADYYVRQGYTERGPTTAARIREMAAQGKVSKDDAIRRGENGDWFRAGDLPGLFDGAGGTDATGELIQDPLVNLAGKAAETAGKAAGLIGKAFGGAVKGIMTRRTQEQAPPAVQSSVTPPTPTVRIPPAELLVPVADSDETTLCPFCSEIIKKTARKCKHCGENLEAGLAVPHAQPNWPAPASPQPPHVIVIQNPAPPAQRPPNITINSPINISNRAKSNASARVNQKTTTGRSSWLTGCLVILLVGAGCVVLLCMGLRPAVKQANDAADKARQKADAGAASVPAGGELAQGVAVPSNDEPVAAVAEQAADDQKPDDEGSKKQSATDAPAEARAESRLKAAKSLLAEGKREQAATWLKRIIAEEPGTDAAKDAEELLAGRKPPPRTPKSVDAHSQSEKSAGHFATKSGTKVAYQIVDSILSANGERLVLVIAIPPSLANENGIVALGHALHERYTKGKHVNAMIFDDARAAGMHKSGADGALPDRDQAFFDKHWIGNYRRNEDFIGPEGDRRSFEGVEIMPDGMGMSQKVLEKFKTIQFK